MFREKQKIINIFLYILISLESIYIGSVYVPVYGIQGIIAGLIYSAIAIVHIYSPTKKLSSVVLIISIGIAVPRLLLTIENRIDDRRKEALAFIVQEESKISEPIKPTYSDCSRLPAWEGQKIKECQESNNKTQEAYFLKIESYNIILNDYSEQRIILKKSIPLTLSDYGSMIMFLILSGSLPAVIFLLLMESSELAGIPEHTGKPNRKEVSSDIIREALILYNKNTPIKKILDIYSGQISRATLYKYIKKKM